MRPAHHAPANAQASSLQLRAEKRQNQAANGADAADKDEDDDDDDEEEEVVEEDVVEEVSA